MDQQLSTETLIDYHFGTLEPSRRAVVEEALLASTTALRAYLMVKREMEGAGISAEAPSAAARARLRLAVLDEHGPGPGRSARRLLGRPVPLYQTLVVAVAAVVVTLLVGGIRGDGGGPGLLPLPAIRGAKAPAVDWARPEPWSQDVL